MPEKFSLRPGNSQDATAISALIHSLAGYFLVNAENPSSAEAFFATVTVEAIRANLSSGSFRYHVAECDGRIVGVIGILNALHIYQLFVDEAFHGRGIARSLWERARLAAITDGNAGRFTVNASLYAVPLYERFGFRRVGSEVQKDGVVFFFMERGENGS